MGSELNYTPGKRGGGNEGGELGLGLPPAFSLVSPRFFLPEFFSRALLSERLEQASHTLVRLRIRVRRRFRMSAKHAKLALSCLLSPTGSNQPRLDLEFTFLTS